MSSDTVKPIPASAATAKTSAHARSLFSSALVKRAASHVPPKMPIVFAGDEPQYDPERLGPGEDPCQRVAGERDPGREEREQRHGETGRQRAYQVFDVLAGECCSPSRRVQRSIRPMATPAMVAWMPLLYISPQMTRASGT